MELLKSQCHFKFLQFQILNWLVLHKMQSVQTELLLILFFSSIERNNVTKYLQHAQRTKLAFL